jgi:hypothetical protein
MVGRLWEMVALGRVRTIDRSGSTRKRWRMIASGCGACGTVQRGTGRAHAGGVSERMM